MSAWLIKVLHTAAIAIWVGGLLATPALLWRRRGSRGDELDRLYRASRFLHVGVVSPAAFVAIASGIALVFIYETWAGWFSLKLLLVGLLAAGHMLTGRSVRRVFEEGHQPGRLLPSVMVAACLIVAVGILALVLGKPDIPGVDTATFAPGALGDRLGPVIEPVIEAVVDAISRFLRP